MSSGVPHPCAATVTRSGGCSSTARAPAFQAGGAGSIPVTRSNRPPRSSPHRIEVDPLNASQKLILGAAAVVFAAGTVLAIVQPGDLGDDEVASGDHDDSTTTSTTEAPTTTTTAGRSPRPPRSPRRRRRSAPRPPRSAAPPRRPPPWARGDDGHDGRGTATTTTTVGSGLGAGGAGTVNPDGTISDTGGESWIGARPGPLGLGLVLRRTSRRPPDRRSPGPPYLRSISITSCGRPARASGSPTQARRFADAEMRPGRIRSPLP